MKNRFNSILLLALTLLFTSCSKEVQTTETTFMLSTASFTSAQASGGILITGTNGVDSFQIATQYTDGQSYDVAIPFGTWNIMGIIWEGPENMTGASKCAAVINKDLFQSEETVDLTFNSVNCTRPVFQQARNKDPSITGIEYRFKPLQLIGCSSLNSSECKNFYKPDGMSKSYKIALASYNSSNEIRKPTLYSQCMNMDLSNTLSLPPNLPILIGSQAKIVTLIDAYEKEDCKNEDRSDKPDYGYLLSDIPQETGGYYNKTDIDYDGQVYFFADNILGNGYGEALIGKLPTNYKDCANGTGSHCLKLEGPDSYELDNNNAKQITGSPSQPDYTDSNGDYENPIKPDEIIKSFGEVFGLPSGVTSEDNDHNKEGIIEDITKVYLGPVNAALAKMGIKNCQDIGNSVGRNFSISLPYNNEVVEVSISSPEVSRVLGHNISSGDYPFRIEIYGINDKGYFSQALESSCLQKYGYLHTQSDEIKDGINESSSSEFYYKDLGEFMTSEYEYYSRSQKDNGEQGRSAIRIQGTGAAEGLKVWSGRYGFYLDSSSNLTEFYSKNFGEKFAGSDVLGVGSAMFNGDATISSNIAEAQMNIFGSSNLYEGCYNPPKFDLNNNGIEFNTIYSGCMTDSTDGPGNNDTLFLQGGPNAIKIGGLIAYDTYK